MNKFKLIAKKIFLSFVLGFNYEKKIEKAHKLLLGNGKLKIIQKIFYEIEKSEIQFDKSSNKILTKYFREKQNHHLTLGQINYSNLILLSSFSSLIQICLAFNKNFYFPLPTEWLIVLKKNNIKVNFFISNNLYILSAMFFFLKDCFKIFFKLFVKNVKIKNPNTLVYLDGLPKNLDNEFNPNDPKYNFLSWCKNYLKIDKKITFIHNNKNISNKKFGDFESVYINYFYLSNFNLFNRFYYFFLFVHTILIFIYYLFRGNIRHLFLLENFFITAWLNKFKSKMPSYTFYNNANYLIKPWWTFALERDDKKKTFMYYYSTNHFPFDTYEKSLLGARLMTWMNYILFTSEQSEYLKKVNNYCRHFDLVGYFPFVGKNINVLKTRKIISLFPVTPFSDKIIFKDGLSDYDYYNLNNSINFFKHILECLKNYDLDIFIKKKRKISKKNTETINKDFIDFTDKLTVDKRIKIIDEDISALSIIEKSDLVISPPYSTPSLIANHFNIPSVFYDSSNKLIQIDPCILKVKLLTSKKNLSSWIGKHL
jgi:polysaccharide biosynthesis PFTS motif protein